MGTAERRIVVVSGGGTGIGRAVSAAFAAEGAEVVALGRRAEPLERAAKELTEEHAAAGGSVRALTADLTEPAEAERVRDELRAAYGRVDVVVNNAGGNVLVGAPEGAADGLAGAAWHWTGNFRSNVLTAVLLTEALRDLLAAPGGRVVLFSSIAAYRGSGAGSYAGAKAALHPYMYDLAADLGPRGVTVNTVAPGYIAETEFFGPDGVAEARRRMLVEQAMNKRAGAPADVAETVRWLASPAAGHVTGQIIQVNGGAEKGR
ncbi:SDR family NAD(P)-dependent oxidoreductase [Streptomyces sp. NPDC101158]|uniref:SDR family NAD(P)-dependent oxidoreductase n=1 Tax=Streptomyces sp. NPDC101158 TaxID=3366117 RepID=UPI0037F3AFCB